MYEELPGNPIRVKKVEGTAPAAAPAAPAAMKKEDYCMIMSCLIMFVFCMVMLQFALDPLVNELRIHNELLNISVFQTAELVAILEKINPLYI